MTRYAALLVAVGLLLQPALAGAAPRQILHTVQKGQYLALIAKRYHTTPEAIRLNNNIKKGQTLFPGQKLHIIEVEEHRRWRKYWDDKVAAKNKPPKKGARAGASSPAQGADPERAKDAARAEAPPSAKVKAPEARKAEPIKAEPRKTEPKQIGPKNETPRDTAKPNSEPNGAPDDEFAMPTGRPGYVILVRQTSKFRGQLVDAKGNVVPATAARVDSLLRSKRNGERHEIDRRLLKLLSQVSDHFGGRSLIIVSGYRPYSAQQFTKNSRHNHGKAIDFRVAGVPARALYDYCRGFRKVGCGYYPNSGFVHMDVREYKTQWTDYSRAGQAPIYAHKLKRSEREVFEQAAEDAPDGEPPPKK